MTDLRVIYRPVAELIPYARNARTHSEAQVAGSIREFGFTNPVLLDGANGILAGHGRVPAARKLGMDRVPTIELAHLSEAPRRAYILAPKLALNAGWVALIVTPSTTDGVRHAQTLDATGICRVAE
jgi:ParB-like chromosome segregation protein Spo0J